MNSVGKNRNINVYTDGGARGNPGTAGTGVVIYDDTGSAIYEATEYLGETTNNQAEYRAFLSAIRKVIEIDPTYVTFHADSDLMVKQINGVYKVKSAELKPIYAEAKKLLSQLQKWEVKHVRRHLNGRADELANMAMDAYDSEVVLDLTGIAPGISHGNSHGATFEGAQPGTLFEASEEKRLLKCMPEDQSACQVLTRSPGMNDLFEFVELAPNGLCLRLLEKVLAYKNEGRKDVPARLACDQCKSGIRIS